MRGHEDSPPSAASGAPRVLRQATESLVLLAVAVMLFRAFAAEGYLISTGSMAPSLLGFHRRVVCPHCHYLFAHGASFEEANPPRKSSGAGPEGGTAGELSPAVCPNCGWDRIDGASVPRNEGDQLLVHKHAYGLRDPRRWEVIVFRNPGDPKQAYVKRVVGLPRETIQIVDGNIVADGKLRRKSFLTQQALRVLVSSEDFLPPADDPEWQPRWSPHRPDTNWQRQGNGFRCEAPATVRSGADWLEYRHWVRSGGMHRTEVHLDRWPAAVRLPDEQTDRLDYDDEAGILCCTGVFSALELRRWLAKSNDPEYQEALRGLHFRSHQGPVTDGYAYNSPEVPAEHNVRELMVEMSLAVSGGDGRFEIEMSDGIHNCVAGFDFARRKLELLLEGDPVPVAEAELPPGLFAESPVVTMSLFDQQVLVAVGGKPLLPGFEFDSPSSETSALPTIRVRAERLDCRIDHICVYRDIYYTAKPPHGVKPVLLGNDEFFVLGDNSPVSMDSRVWPDPAVSRSALIGKPLVVHLPSKPGRITWAGHARPLRIPDFSRIRYIH